MMNPAQRVTIAEVQQNPDLLLKLLLQAQGVSLLLEKRGDQIRYFYLNVAEDIELDDDEQYEAWLKLSAQGLSTAYGDNGPDYPLSLVKKPNPDYETG